MSSMMDMTWVIVMLGVLLIVLVTLPLLAVQRLAAREDRGHRSRRTAQREAVEAQIDADTVAPEVEGRASKVQLSNPQDPPA